ncbi:MAG: CHAP domain-containing protein [Oscillospiraceae bacterium]|nr:CHAP domain-containing protein [Oscillospiraceae bacterium]
MKRNNDGFTLVELLVIIAASSIVMLAAASLLMLGVRVQRAAQEDAGEQQTVRIVLSALENLSASGKIKNIDQTDANGWAIYGDDSALLRYWADEKALRAGDDPDGAVLVDGLQSANVQLVGSLLTFTFGTENHNYSTSVYCRTQVDVDVAAGENIVEELKRPSQEGGTGSVTFPDAASLTEAEKAARYAFLQVLADQYGSTGQIVGSDLYYSAWYIGGYGESHPGWNEDTPWCACFLSWAAAQQAASLNSEPPRFADVDDGKAYFQNPETQGLWGIRDAYTPIPGDYIFFDWSGGSDPDHAGAVLCVEGGKVYTIEGNSSGRVAVHSYSLSDPRIVGYGVLDWNKGTEATE